MQTTDLIEKQITNCQELLTVFKSERETYGDSESINLNSVMGMLKRKQDILQSFGEQRVIMQDIQSNGHQDEINEKKLLRELGSILEQLLVIDQDNEVLLRNLLGKQPGKAPKKSQSNISQSPELPFIPGQRKIKTTPVAPPQENVKEKFAILQEQPHLFSRKKLKAYGA